MKPTSILTLALFGATLSHATALQAEEKTLTVCLTNDWDKPQTDAPVVLSLAEYPVRFDIRSAVVRDGDREIPCQLDDLDADRKPDELAFVVDLPAQSTLQLTVTLSSEPATQAYPSRVFAGMLLRDVKKGQHQPVRSLSVPGSSDIYNLVYPHGPMLESELVGYRIYFNHKQTLDPYGKFHKRLELEQCCFYPTDEQLSQGFGDDVLRVFDSCGPGTLKGWDGQQATHASEVDLRTERIVATGPVRAIVEVADEGWHYQGGTLNMTTRYTLYAGHRDLEVGICFDRPLAQQIFCTGVQNIAGSTSYSDHEGLVACWGTDWPVNDTVKYAKETVGLATCIPAHHLVREAKDKDNYLYLVHAPGKARFTYHTMFTSTKETFGYPDAEAWFEAARLWKERLAHPCKITVKRK